jgi:hypothetical protein
MLRLNDHALTYPLLVLPCSSDQEGIQEVRQGNREALREILSHHGVGTRE